MRLARSRVLGLFAAAAALPPRAARAQNASVRIGYAATDIGSYPLYGKSLGIFAKAGIDVELTAFNNSQAISNAAAAGAVDVGASDMLQMANGFIHGVPFGYFAGAALYSSAEPTLVLCVAKDSPYRKATDFEGQTIVVIALNSVSSISVQEWLHVNGADLAKVKIFEAPFPTMIPGLERGTFAAALMAEPFVTLGAAQTRQVARTYDSIGKEFYVNAWFANRDWIKRSPDVARRFRTAIYETAQWANTHHPESAVMLADITKLPLENIRTMKRAIFATSLDTKLMQPVLDVGLRYKAIEKQVAAADLIAVIPG
jgi:NitT/TauT family transport system substrate-binding protein